jgi:hypothetical protein
MIRLVSLIQMQEMRVSRDIPFKMLTLALWAWAEISLGIMVVCGMLLPRLMRDKSEHLKSIYDTACSPFVSFRKVLEKRIIKSTSRSSPTSEIQLREVDQESMEVGRNKRDFSSLVLNAEVESCGVSLASRPSEGQVHQVV